MDERELLTHRISEINGNVRCVIQVYMAWYTFFWILNGTALAIHFSDGGPLPWFVRVFFCLICVPSVVSSFLVRSSIDRKNSWLSDLTQALLGLGVFDSESQASEMARSVFQRPLWDMPLVNWGLVVNGCCSGLLTFVWLIV